jgi:hypothetical protein
LSITRGAIGSERPYDNAGASLGTDVKLFQNVANGTLNLVNALDDRVAFAARSSGALLKRFRTRANPFLSAEVQHTLGVGQPPTISPTLCSSFGLHGHFSIRHNGHLSTSESTSRPSAWIEAGAVWPKENGRFPAIFDGASRTRTGDLLGAIQLLF